MWSSEPQIVLLAETISTTSYFKLPYFDVFSTIIYIKLKVIVIVMTNKKDTRTYQVSTIYK